MRRKIFGFLTIALAAVLLAEIVRSYPLWYPYRHFEFQSELGNYTVYSDQAIDQDAVRGILQDVSDRLAIIEIHDPGRTFEIFICQDSDLYALFARKAGKQPQSQGMNLQPLSYTFINTSLMANMKQQYGPGEPYSLLSGDTAHIITHELVHELIRVRLGYLEARNLPAWKAEGYAEYAASLHKRKVDTDYRLTSRIADFYSEKYQGVSSGRIFYIRSALLVEYLLDIKGISFSELMDPSVSEEQTIMELEKWHTGFENISNDS